MSAVLGMSARTVADQISDRLRSELLAGAHPGRQTAPRREVGQALRRQPASRFAKRCRSSRSKGCLNARPNCGVVVAAFAARACQRPADAHAEAARALCPAAGVSQARPTPHGEWQTIIRRMQRAGEDQNVQELLDHDAAFHQHLLIAAGLDEMIPVWQGIYARMRDHHQQGIREHADLRISPTSTNA